MADLQLITARRQIQAGEAVFARRYLLRLAVEADLFARLQFEVHQRHRLRWRRRLSGSTGADGAVCGALGCSVRVFCAGDASVFCATARASSLPPLSRATAPITSSAATPAPAIIGRENGCCAR